MVRKNALILSPHADFGAIVRQGLDRVDSLNVHSATTLAEINQYFPGNQKLHYVLIDMELGPEEALRAGLFLRDEFPTVKLVLISRQDPPPELDEIQPWAILKKPFSQRELFSLFRAGNETIREEPGVIDLHPREKSSEAIPSWLVEGSRATQMLHEAISDLDVQEALVLSRDSLLVHTGCMLPEAIEECSRILHRSWKSIGKTEVITPIQLETTRKDLLVHAIGLTVGIILALIYDAQTPYSIILSQTRHLTRFLKDPQLPGTEQPMLPRVSGVPVSSGHVRRKAARPAPDHLQTYQQVTAALPPLKQVRKTTPPVSQRKEPPASFKPAIRSDPGLEIPSFELLNGKLIYPGGPEREQAADAPAGKPRRRLGAIDPRMIDVYYACILVPRVKLHTLDGELAEFLRGELRRLFPAYGWRLEALQIDPAYLQWLAMVPPTIAPTDHVKTVRKRSSRLILANFDFGNENKLMHDFWAPGYLLGSGKNLFPREKIQEFIELNRQQYYAEGSSDIPYSY